MASPLPVTGRPEREREREREKEKEKEKVLKVGELSSVAQLNPYLLQARRKELCSKKPDKCENVTHPEGLVQTSLSHLIDAYKFCLIETLTTASRPTSATKNTSGGESRRRSPNASSIRRRRVTTNITRPGRSAGAVRCARRNVFVFDQRLLRDRIQEAVVDDDAGTLARQTQLTAGDSAAWSCNNSYEPWRN
ncbi:hypothetical protein EVAR_44204_1 [Eumeta japonica]|uniref:Uncharacterized protein n=1 Tax=Eumeta variegata TaxID=151549 RepID=A0A4C1VZJ6_EUMVA|nr:hypothetical protein EVAR_44204_1 [Eumeta japonica]